MSHFSDIGFIVETPEDLDTLIASAIADGKVYPAEHGSYVYWALDGGIEMWVQTNHNDQVVGFNPHFSGSSRVQVAMVNTAWQEDMPLDGSLYVHVVSSDDLEQLVFMVDMPDFGLVHTRLAPDSVHTLQVAAFAHELNIFADEAEFEATSAQLDDGMRFAAESFFPAGLLAEKEEDTAMAFFSGRIEEHNRRDNPFTGKLFHHLLIRTLLGTLDVVADPQLVQATPRSGGLV
ncbi:MAG: hypothetical protein ACFB51_05715, partial [Anaerolineae bacterium]